MLPDVTYTAHLPDFNLIQLKDVFTTSENYVDADTTGGWNQCSIAIVKIYRFLIVYAAEISTLLYYVGFAIFTTVMSSIIYEKVCIINTGYSYEQCKDFDDYPPELQSLVQDDSITVNMYSTIAFTLPSVVSSVIISAWSDRVGRKPAALLGLASTQLCLLATLVYATLTWSPLWLLPALFAPFSLGGFNTVATGAFINYIADLDIDEETLTIRMTVLMNSFALGYVIGGSICAVMVTGDMYPAAILVAMVLTALSTVYTYVFMQNHIPAEGIPKPITVVEQPAAPWLMQLKQLTVDVYVAYTRRRKGNDRTVLIVAIVAYFFYITLDQGLYTVLNLFVYQSPLSFSATDWSTYVGATAAINMVGAVLGTVILKRIFHTSDITVTIIGIVSAIIRILIMAGSRQNSAIGLSSVLGFLSTMGYPSIEAFVAGVAEPEERGKIMAGLGIATSFAPLFANVVYLPVYQATYNQEYKGAVFLFAAGLHVLSLLGFVWIYFVRKRDSQLERMVLEPEDD